MNHYPQKPIRKTIKFPFNNSFTKQKIIRLNHLQSKSSWDPQKRNPLDWIWISSQLNQLIRDPKGNWSLLHDSQKSSRISHSKNILNYCHDIPLRKHTSYNELLIFRKMAKLILIKRDKFIFRNQNVDKGYGSPVRHTYVKWLGKYFKVSVSLRDICSPKNTNCLHFELI